MFISIICFLISIVLLVCFQKLIDHVGDLLQAFVEEKYRKPKKRDDDDD